MPPGAGPVPESIGNHLGGKLCEPATGAWFEKRDPHSGEVLWRAARSGHEDVDAAVATARDAQREWATTPAVERGLVLHRASNLLEARADDVAAIVHRETGKSRREARGEVAGAVALGRFYAGEGQRLYGRTTTSGVAHRQVMTVRQPVGVAGLIVPANTPIANVAWKAFPALVCGNAAVLKSSEGAPATAHLFATILTEAGLPPGTLNVVHGFGDEAGAPLVAHDHVGVISFTGSTMVGRVVAQVAGARLARVSLELGGRNAFVVADDADLPSALRWAVLSAFSNAGQRCASGSRLILFDTIYEQFRSMLVDRVAQLRIGPGDDDDLGPVIGEGALARMLQRIDEGVRQGATVLTGGHRLADPDRATGYYLAPTVIEGVDRDAPLACEELFGPVTVLRRVAGLSEAIEEVASSPYGLTACIHTTSWNRAMTFAEAVRTGVVSVNGGTYGSEPHMPFGGTGASGNGTREPGTEALDVYSDLKDLYLNVDPGAV